MNSLLRLEACEDIRQLKARYFRFLDAKDFASMAGVFSAAAVFDLSGHTPPGPVTTGREQIIEWIRTSMAEHSSTHHGHGHEIEIDSATEAHGIVAMEDDIRLLDRTTRVSHGTGHYTEQYQIEDGAWRISRVALTRIFSDKFTEH